MVHRRNPRFSKQLTALFAVLLTVGLVAAVMSVSLLAGPAAAGSCLPDDTGHPVVDEIMGWVHCE